MTTSDKKSFLVRHPVLSFYLMSCAFFWTLLILFGTVVVGALQLLALLLERRHARLVGHVVLAVLHRGDADRAALVRDGGADDQLQRVVLVDGGARIDPACLRVALGEGEGELVLGGVEGDDLRARVVQHIGNLRRGQAPVDADQHGVRHAHKKRDDQREMTEFGNHRKNRDGGGKERDTPQF